MTSWLAFLGALPAVRWSRAEGEAASVETNVSPEKRTGRDDAGRDVLLTDTLADDDAAERGHLFPSLLRCLFGGLDAEWGG